MTPTERAEKIFGYADFCSHTSWPNCICKQWIAAEVQAAVEDEREACAKIADKYVTDPYNSDTRTEAENLAAEIRYRGGEEKRSSIRSKGDEMQLQIVGEEQLYPCWRCERKLPAAMFIVEQCVDCDKELKAED